MTVKTFKLWPESWGWNPWRPRRRCGNCPGCWEPLGSGGNWCPAGDTRRSEPKSIRRVVLSRKDESCFHVANRSSQSSLCARRFGLSLILPPCFHKIKHELNVNEWTLPSGVFVCLSRDYFGSDMSARRRNVGILCTLGNKALKKLSNSQFSFSRASWSQHEQARMPGGMHARC